MQEQLLNSSNAFKVIGVGRVLDNLLQDVKTARKSLFVVGPWIDGYFIRAIVGVLHQSVSVRFLLRPTERDTIVLGKSLLPPGFSIEARSLPTLHAKVIIIDDNFFRGQDFIHQAQRLNELSHSFRAFLTVDNTRVGNPLGVIPQKVGIVGNKNSPF